MLLAFIEWSVSPEIFHLGPVSVRWYGFLFAMAFVAGYFIMTWIFKKEGRPQTDLEQLSSLYDLRNSYRCKIRSLFVL